MTRALADLRCFRHSAREAAGRCPECQNYFCRECLVEHERRVVCSNCLERLVATGETRRAGWMIYLQCGHLLLGLLLAFIFYYSLGSVILRIPATVHEGSVWQTSGTTDRP